MEAFQELLQEHRLARRIFLLASRVSALRETGAKDTVDILIGSTWVRCYGKLDELLEGMEMLRESMDDEWVWDDGSEEGLEPEPDKGDTSGE